MPYKEHEVKHTDGKHKQSDKNTCALLAMCIVVHLIHLTDNHVSGESFMKRCTIIIFNLIVSYDDLNAATI